MTTEAEQLLAAALKTIGLHAGAGFSPTEVGAKVGLDEFRSQAAARALSNAGILVLGFDSAAEFSVQYRKSRVLAKQSEAGRSPAARKRGRPKGPVVNSPPVV